MRRLSLWIFLLLLSMGVNLFSALGTCPASANDELLTASNSLIQNYCVDCHTGDTAEGSLDLTELGQNLADERIMATWVRIYDRIERQEMPPHEAEQPSDLARERYLSSVKPLLIAAHEQDKGTVFRRLNRREYSNTLNDLFGTNIDFAAQLPADGRAHEFDNVGSALNVSVVQMERYIEAARQVLDESIEKRTEPPAVETKRASYADMRGADKFIGNQWLKLDDGAVVFYRALGYPSGMLREANTNKSGYYKIRVTGYAHQSEHPITFAIGATSFQRGSEKPTFGYFQMPPGEPTTIETEAWIEQRYMIELTPYGIYDANYEIKKNGIEKYQGPGLAILHVELEGPLVKQFPSRGHRLVMDGLNRQEILPRNPSDRKKPWYQPKFEIKAEEPMADATQVLLRVAGQAFRRPVNESDIAPYRELLAAELNQGTDFETALKHAVTAIFCSPGFLYLHEPPGELDDYALANRLAYFLTRTQADEELLQAAAACKLTSDPQELIRQTERLLGHPHAHRFVQDFTDSWLNLRDLEFTNPDKNLFPEFDAYLQFSMQRETHAFFRKLVDENLPVRNIVASDFAMLNERMANLYQIPDVVGTEFREVALPKDSLRGGFLSQASILKVSANGTNTSPVVRGVWVLERILGEHAPPPPPGVPGVEPDIRGATTLREILQQHRDVESCNACHQLIDPPGFALECFNPIGGFRERYRSLGEGERIALVVGDRKVRYKLGPAVDASGTFQGGDAFENYLGFREQLAERQPMLAKTLLTKLLIFATGREMGFSDRDQIEHLVQAAAAQGYGVRDMIHLVVTSEIFRNK